MTDEDEAEGAALADGMTEDDDAEGDPEAEGDNGSADETPTPPAANKPTHNTTQTSKRDDARTPNPPRIPNGNSRHHHRCQRRPFNKKCDSQTGTTPEQRRHEGLTKHSKHQPRSQRSHNPPNGTKGGEGRHLRKR